MIIEIEDIKKINVNPGDVIVIRANRKISAESAFRINQFVIGALPDNKVIILDGDLELSVLTPNKE